MSAGSAAYPRQPVAIGDSRAIRDAAFSLQITQGQERESIEFLIDGKTEMERKLQVGSSATVEYRSVDGNNVVIQVVVAPAAGLKAR